MSKQFTWKRWEDGSGAVTETDDVGMTKQDWLDCLTDAMETGNVTLIDVLDHFSPTNRYKR